MIKTTIESLTQQAFPILYRFALSAEEIGALTRQGAIRSEKRGGKTIFRLRYRVDGRQHVRYISPNNAAALEAELRLLQKRVRACRYLNSLAALARQALRDRRLTLTPILQARGCHFHGHQIRRRRKR